MTTNTVRIPVAAAVAQAARWEAAGQPGKAQAIYLAIGMQSTSPAVGAAAILLAVAAGR